MIFKAPRVWRTIIASVALVAAIVVTYLMIPESVETRISERSLFEDYAAVAVMKLDSVGALKVDNDCNMQHPEPELAYVLPLIVGAYNEIVEKPTTPIVTRLDDTLYFTMSGYRQFKNRGIRLNRLLQKKLGKRYKTQIVSEGSSHTLVVTYDGEPWDTEQLTALPVMEAAQIHHLDPALLMSLIQHVSNFNFSYRGRKDSRGILSLKEGEGIEQIFIGAERLGKMFQVGVSQENAVATFYPDPEINSKPENWSKSPLTKSWVDQVLSDVEFYHENGLNRFAD
ncbi:hypothetical protein [Fibrobacter sp.]|uniref:hypothetical protein n=1 Tax=Fibrobacter sp. TaxID=35828 RepID=UPI00388FE4E2